MNKTFRRVQLSLVRETAEEPYDKTVSSSAAVYRLLRPLIADKPQEEFYALYLDSRHRIVAVHQVSRGTADSAHVHPRDVFGPALMLAATAIIVAHNHPSGDVQPSQEDRQLTERLRKAGDLLGIHCLDHLIVGTSSFYSFAEGATLTN